MLTRSIRKTAGLLLLGASVWHLAAPAIAATPKDVLSIVSEQGPNSLDTMIPTANDHSRMVVWQAYDRLVSHGEKTLPNGAVSYDAAVVTPELAERWEISKDKKVYTFFCAKMRRFTTAPR